MTSQTRSPVVMLRRRSLLSPVFVPGQGLVILALAALAYLAGCADRTYLTKSHGRAYSEAFGRQKANPDPPAKTRRADATQGLDSQEAAAVAGTYRRSLAGREGGETTRQPMLIMNPASTQSAAANMPPPSVPGGQ